MSLTLDVNVENEQVVIGALINDPEAFRDVLPRLDPALFAEEKHRALVSALRELRKRGAGYAADTVVELTGEEVKFKYLRDLEENFGALPKENLKVHLEVLRSSSAKYAASEAFFELYGALDDAHAPAAEAEAAALSVLRNLRERTSGGTRLRGGNKLFSDWYGNLADLAAKKTQNFVGTQFSALDAHLYEGLRPSKVVVIAARPGMGKSTLCSNLTLRLERVGLNVLSVPVEAGTESVVEQMACCKAKVSAEKVIKTPDELTPGELMSLQRAGRKILSSERIQFDDEMASLDDLEMAVEGRDFDVVILDLFEYLLQGELDSAFVTEQLRRLKRLAKRRNFCAVVVQQIRRIKRKKNPRPLLAELKNSGGYEEVADLVILLHRAAYYNPETCEEDVLEMKIAKQRRGPQNVTVGFKFHPDICRVGAHTKDYDGSS